MKHTLHLNQPLLEFAFHGEAEALVTETKPSRETVALVLSRFLQASRSMEPLKCLDWAVSLWNRQPIDLDEADYQALVKNLEEDKQLPRVVTGQILRALREEWEACKAARA